MCTGDHEVGGGWQAEGSRTGVLMGLGGMIHCDMIEVGSY